MNYYLLIFSFLRSGNNAKHGVEFRDLTRNALKFRRKVTYQLYARYGEKPRNKLKLYSVLVLSQRNIELFYGTNGFMIEN